jgi:aminoglycoside phosphotransferase (APT) family kinase protein
MGELPEAYAKDPDWRQRIGLEMVEGAAALAAIDHEAVGLADFGKPERWLERQVSRWKSQLAGYSEMEGYDVPDLPGVNELGTWLQEQQPKRCRIGIIHGDYQFANVMFSPTEPRLAAVVDWELSTLGDPLLDLAWMLTAWWEDGDPEGRGPQLSPWADMGTRAELIEHYGRVSGRDMSDMPWFFVLGCYKLGILLEGTHARACAGKAPREIGDQLHAYARWLFAKGQQFIAGI